MATTVRYARQPWYMLQPDHDTVLERLRHFTDAMALRYGDSYLRHQLCAKLQCWPSTGYCDVLYWQFLCHLSGRARYNWRVPADLQEWYRDG